MDFGIGIASASDSWKTAQRAEELGFTHAWFYDTQMITADPFVAMAAAAVKTSKIRLGTGVLVPSNRIAPAAANAFASLNKLAPGRIDFGIGTGFTARRAMGLGAVKLADLETYIQAVTALLRGETIDFEIEGKRRLIRLLNPELGLINTTDPIGLYIAASGPRARQLTAKLGAGWINTVAGVAGAIADLERMRQLWLEAGHDADSTDAIVLAAAPFWSRASPPTRRAPSHRRARARRCCCTAPPMPHYWACRRSRRSRMRSPRPLPAMSSSPASSGRRARPISKTIAGI